MGINKLVISFIASQKMGVQSVLLLKEFLRRDINGSL